MMRLVLGQVGVAAGSEAREQRVPGEVEVRARQLRADAATSREENRTPEIGAVGCARGAQLYAASATRPPFPRHHPRDEALQTRWCHDEPC